MCGTPKRSRTTRTGADTPSTANVPETGGEAGGGGGATASRRQATRAEVAQAASSHFVPRLPASTLHRMAIRDGLLAEYDHEMGTTRKLLERIPEDKFSWKPHERSRTLGELSTHLSGLPQWGGTILNDSSFDLAAGPPNPAAQTSRTALLERFDTAVAQTRASMDKSDAEYAARWSLKRGGHEMFSMPRVAAFRSFILGHMIHHRGQLSVYLRMTNVPVPAIYGPSADEG